jgi:hypothetical protein
MKKDKIESGNDEYMPKAILILKDLIEDENGKNNQEDRGR